jgi:hypothetical protein
LEISDKGLKAWTRGVDRVTGRKGWLRPVSQTYASGHLKFQWTVEPSALFHVTFYLSPMAGSSSLSWPFALT